MGWIILALVVLVGSISLLLLTPFVQTKLAQYASSWIQENYGVEIEIGYLALKPIKRIELQEVLVLDHQQDTLFYIGSLDADIGVFGANDTQTWVTLGAVRLEDPEFHLHKYKGDSISNLLIFANQFGSNSPNDTSSSGDFVLNCDQLTVDNGDFKWDNDYEERIPFGVDWEHIHVDSLNLDFEDVALVNDSVNAFINYFSLKEQSGFHIDTLHGAARYSNSITQVEGMKIKTPYTHLDGMIRFNYNTVTDYADFISAIQMRGTLNHSHVDFRDIAFFAPDLQGLKEGVDIDAKVRGTVENLKIRKAKFGLADGTRLEGNFDLDGLPDVESMFINARIDQLVTHYNDLNTLPSYPFDQGGTIDIPSFLNRADSIYFDGSFVGFLSDFVAYGNVKTDVGDLRTDIKLYRNKQGVISYRGQLNTNQLDVGELFDVPSIGHITTRLTVDGSGESFDKVVADFGGNIALLEIEGYQYQHIKLNGELVKGRFEGMFDIHDTNLILSFDGSVDLLDSIPQFQFIADIDRFNPVALNLLERETPVSVQTQLEFNFQGASLDDIIGRVYLYNLNVSDGDKYAKLAFVKLLAASNEGGRLLSIESPDLNAYVSGRFDTDGLVQMGEQVGHLLFPTYVPNKPGWPKNHQNFRLEAHLKRNTQFSGMLASSVDQLRNLDLSLTANSEQKLIDVSYKVNEVEVEGFMIDTLIGTLVFDQDSINSQLHASSIQLSDSGFVHNIVWNASARQDVIKNQLDWNNKGEVGYSGDLQLDLSLLSTDMLQLVLHPSQIVVADSLWSIDKDATILMDTSSVSFQNFKIHSGTQMLYIQGKLGELSDERLDIEAEHFQLSNLNELLKSYEIALNGELHGTTFIQRPQNQLYFGSDVHITNLLLNEWEVGDVDLGTRWVAPEKRLKIDMGIIHDEIKTFRLTGDYFPNKVDSNIQLSADFGDFPLEVLNAFLGEYVSIKKGDLDGAITIAGNIDHPSIQGNMNFDSLVTGVNYLGTTYTIPNGNLFIEPDLIGGDQIPIIDQDGRTSYANLSIFHSNFSDLNYDIWVYAQDGMRGMSIPKGENEYFYGNAILKPGSSVTLESTEDKRLRLLVEAATNRGTEVYIPLSEGTTVASADFVHFVNYNAPIDSSLLERRRKKEKSNFEMDFELDVNDDAFVQLILDPIMGDAIDAYGKGEVSLEIDASDNFYIYGTYELTQGSYLFTLENIINKKFDILQGSTINWDGDPYNGIADITTTYKTRTNIYELNLPTLNSGDTTQSSRKVEVILNLHLTGNYMNPDITFSFSLPTQYAEVETVLNSLEEGEKNRQVFGLLLLSKFFPLSEGGSDGLNNAIGKSTSEMLSNQLSSWLSQISDDFDLGVNYRPGDQLTADEVEVMMSTQLWNDRVTLETQVGVTGDDPSQQNSGQIVGDFLLEYKISEDGRVKGKAFNRSNTFNPIYANQAQYTQGVGISYQENFSSWHHLGCRIRKRLLSKEKQEKLDCDEIERKRLELKQEKLIEKYEAKKAKKR